MEKSRLCPELQSIVDQFAKFRNKYSTLKTHYAAQEELMRLQELELEKMNSRVEQLATALIDYQRRFNVTLSNLEMENQRIHNRIVDNSRDNDNAYVSQVQRDNDERIRSLEDELAVLRAKIITDNEKHRGNIESMMKRHSDEISLYKKKLEEKNNTGEKSISSSNKQLTYTHPALDDTAECKRKKSAPAAPSRWPQLDFMIEKDVGAAPQAKKKKLYQADKNMIVDLAL